LLAFDGIRGRCAQSFKRPIDGLVDDVPFGGGARLQRGVGIVPFDLEVLDAVLSANQVALVDQGGDVNDDDAERREVAELR
jgi:hypothetical protein